MTRKSIKLSEENHKRFFDETKEGTADERIIELLSTKTTLEVSIERIRQQKDIISKREIRIAELEEAKENILANQSSPDKQRRLDFDKYAFDRTIEFKTQKHNDDTAISKMDRFASLGIQMMKQGIVTEDDMRPIINIVLPKLAAMMADMAQIEGEVNLAIEESKDVE